MSPATPFVELDAVGVRFGEYSALEDTTLSIDPGQFVAIVGPTGCGKSSLLNMVGGLLMPTSGAVRVDGQTVRGVNPHAAYMCQHDALFPWRRVIDNVAFGPQLRGLPAADARDDARRWLDRVGLHGLENRYPHQLSGGQRKRAAMAQVLVNGRPLLLMDEPFGELDAQTRALMENELLDLWSETGATVLFVTHDLGEAIALADRVVLIGSGPRARVIADHHVDLPRPRDIFEARSMPGFAELYDSVWSKLRGEVLTAYERSRSGA